MKHTPGPWYWDSEGLGSKDVLVFGKGYPFEMTGEGNKRLIAAAPDLLEALQLFLDAQILLSITKTWLAQPSARLWGRSDEINRIA